MMRYINSLGTHLVLVIFFSFLVPLSIGVTYSLHTENARIESEFNEFQESIVASLHNKLFDAVENLEPTQVKKMLRLVIQDPRIARVKVFSYTYNMILADLSKIKDVNDSNLLIKKQNFTSGDDLIGYVEVYLDRQYHQNQIYERRRSIFLLFAGMFAGGISILVPFIYFKLIRPTVKLMVQAESISSGDMNSSFDWNGDDELSRLGNTLDEMRHKLKSSFERIEKLAVTDELTGMPNRRAFQHEADKIFALGERYNIPFSVALLDIDFFKSVNDDFGHATGDNVLQIIAQLIMRVTRKTDICARYGGEEFIICMPETSLAEAQIVVEKLRLKVESHTFPHGRQVTLSAGLAAYSSQKDLQEVIQLADQALYAAKSNGRNQVMAHPEYLYL